MGSLSLLFAIFCGGPVVWAAPKQYLIKVIDEVKVKENPNGPPEVAPLAEEVTGSDYGNFDQIDTAGMGWGNAGNCINCGHVHVQTMARTAMAMVGATAAA